MTHKYAFPLFGKELFRQIKSLFEFSSIFYPVSYLMAKENDNFCMPSSSLRFPGAASEMISS